MAKNSKHDRQLGRNSLRGHGRGRSPTGCSHAANFRTTMGRGGHELPHLCRAEVRSITHLRGNCPAHLYDFSWTMAELRALSGAVLPIADAARPRLGV